MDEYGGKWKVLMEKVRKQMEKGSDPASAEVQLLAIEWNSLVLAFTGGNSQIEFRLQEMYKQEPKMREQAGMDQELYEFVGKMMRYFSTVNRLKA
jgi:hypothetical protein